MLRYLSKVLYIISDSKLKLILLLLGFIVSSLLETTGIGLLGPFMTIASDPDRSDLPWFLEIIKNKLSITSNSELIIGLGLSIIVFFCIKSLITFSLKSYVYHFSSYYKSKISLKLLRSYLNVPYEFHLKRNTSSLIKNIVIETNNLHQTCLLPLLNIVSNFIIITFLLSLLAFTDFNSLVIILVFLLPLIFGFHSLRNKFTNWGKTISQSQQSMITTINHAMGGLKESKVIGCEQYFEEEMAIHVNKYARSITFYQSFQALPRTVIETVLIIFVVLMIITAQSSSTHSVQDITGILSVFAIAGMRLIPSLSILFQSTAQIRNGSFAVNMLYRDLKDIDNQIKRDSSKALLDHESDNPEQILSQRSDSMIFDSSLKLEQISYHYSPNELAALTDISLEIRKGESIAFIGKSGAGKTTLVDIILGLLKPGIGNILVDEVSIYTNLRSWQNLVGYIPQSIFLIDDTVERNIAYGVHDNEIDRVKLQEVIQATQLSDFINTLPQGVHTEVGERGVRLSGGQKQRIGIARALYHEREILVLDEATSALDTETESLISDSIQALAGNKTLIVIAHRLSTIEHCDRVYVLEQGRIVKSGSYQEIVLQTC